MQGVSWYSCKVASRDNKRQIETSYLFQKIYWNFHSHFPHIHPQKHKKTPDQITHLNRKTTHYWKEILWISAGTVSYPDNKCNCTNCKLKTNLHELFKKRGHWNKSQKHPVLREAWSLSLHWFSMARFKSLGYRLSVVAQEKDHRLKKDNIGGRGTGHWGHLVCWVWKGQAWLKNLDWWWHGLQPWPILIKLDLNKCIFPAVLFHENQYSVLFLN